MIGSRKAVAYFFFERRIIALALSSVLQVASSIRVVRTGFAIR